MAVNEIKDLSYLIIYAVVPFESIYFLILLSFDWISVELILSDYWFEALQSNLSNLFSIITQTTCFYSTLNLTQEVHMPLN